MFFLKNITNECINFEFLWIIINTQTTMNDIIDNNNLLSFFKYETKNDNELLTVELKNVEFTILYQSEYTYFLSTFLCNIIDKVVITDKFIEFHIDDKRRRILSN